MMKVLSDDEIEAFEVDCSAAMALNLRERCLGTIRLVLRQSYC